MHFDEDRVRAALGTAWSVETAVQWTPDNPAAGQCNVTAAVIHDLFGGEVLRTQLPGVWHYYNWLEGRRVDLTDSQFNVPGAVHPWPDPYEDHLSTAAAAMTGIPQREYDVLKERLLEGLTATR